MFSLRELNCNLCPGFVRGDCGGCFSDSHCYRACPLAPCSVEHGNIEYCFQCVEYPCKKYEGFDQHDSMVLHRNIRKDVAYKEEQREKKIILDRLFEEYDDGQRNVFFCLAVNMLEIADLKKVLGQAEIATGDMILSDKAKTIEQLLHACEKERNLILELHVTDDSWFE